jgi:hypothetical protein
VRMASGVMATSENTITEKRHRRRYGDESFLHLTAD